MMSVWIDCHGEVEKNGFEARVKKAFSKAANSDALKFLQMNEQPQFFSENWIPEHC